MSYEKKWFIGLLFIFQLIVYSGLVALESRLEHRQGSGIGYKKRYSKIEVYHAFENQDFSPFIDFRYLILNQGKQGANLGGGLGYQFSKKNRLSAYAYFDLAESKTGYLFNQMMAGFSYTHPLIFFGEDLGEFACYLNGYFPMKSLEKNVSNPSFSRFKGHRLLINLTNRYALTGTNFELGYLSNAWKNWNFYLGGGSYYFKRADLHTFGGYGKLRLIYNDLIYGEVFISGDRLFGTNVNGTIGIRIPLGKREMQVVKKRHYCPHKSRPIERFEPIILEKSSREGTAKNSAGNPLYFIFVNNLSGSNGTFEDPFPTLMQAQNSSNVGDFIYIFTGDGSTTGMDKGITLKPFQTLAGSATDLPVSTKQGMVTVPPFTSKNPQIRNSVDHAVILAENCLVNGIDAVNSAGSGFTLTTSSRSSTITMRQCNAFNNFSVGFDFLCTGSSELKVLCNQCSANMHGDNGFRLGSTDSSRLTGQLIGCSSLEGNGLDGFEFLSINNSQMTVSLNRCSAANKNGLAGFEWLSSDDSTMVVSCNKCSTINNGAIGFDFVSEGASNLQAVLNSCSATDNVMNGFRLNSNNTSTASVSLNQCSSNNGGSLLNPDATGFFALSDGSSQLTAFFNQCSADNNGNIGGTGNGFSIFSRNSSQLTAFLAQCSAENNGQKIGGTGDGFLIASEGITSQLTASLANCSANNNKGNGFSIAEILGSLSGSIETCVASENTVNSFDISTSNTNATIDSDATLSIGL